jgi:hypothetical protein
MKQSTQKKQSTQREKGTKKLFFRRAEVYGITLSQQTNMFEQTLLLLTILFILMCVRMPLDA